ncbi:hypothetical protein ABZ079_29585 [Streptomyces sp. NPDC006314]|uniref:hypothetical protein n=1 Tax=Streptomyces sp. NPDC006314 TaxID=3154475 RepID=UPI0033ACE869
MATPTGSTAYGFAAGGPVVSPRAEGLVLTPAVPRMAFNRSVVTAPDEPWPFGYSNGRVRPPYASPAKCAACRAPATGPACTPLPAGSRRSGRPHGPLRPAAGAHDLTDAPATLADGTDRSPVAGEHTTIGRSRSPRPATRSGRGPRLCRAARYKRNIFRPPRHATIHHTCVSHPIKA